MEENKKNKKSNNKILYVIIGILIVVIIILLLRSCGADTNVNNPIDSMGDYEVTDTQKEKVPSDEPVVKNDGTITFSGFGKYTVSSKNPSVELHNSEKNTVDFIFTLKDKASGKLIAQTKKIRPGEYVYVNVMDYYKQAGVYNVSIQTSTFDSESGQQMNGMNQEMEVIVK